MHTHARHCASAPRLLQLQPHGDEGLHVAARAGHDQHEHQRRDVLWRLLQRQVRQRQAASPQGGHAAQRDCDAAQRAQLPVGPRDVLRAGQLVPRAAAALMPLAAGSQQRAWPQRLRIAQALAAIKWIADKHRVPG